MTEAEKARAVKLLESMANYKYSRQPMPPLRSDDAYLVNKYLKLFKKRLV